MPACILRAANPFFAYVSLKNLQACFLFSGENSNEPIFGRMDCLQDRWAKMVQMSLRSKRMSNAKHYEWSFRQRKLKIYSAEWIACKTGGRSITNGVFVR